VNTNTATRAAMYRENFDFALAAKEPHPRRYLVLYQTDFAECLKTEQYVEDVRHASGLFPSDKPTVEIGDFDARNYSLVQEYDPQSKGEGEFPAGDEIWLESVVSLTCRT
jgi:hypothetical protein